MLEGITYRRTQNHLKPFKSCQKTQINEGNKEQSHKITLIQSDSINISQRLKRNIKAPVKLNL